MRVKLTPNQRHSGLAPLKIGVAQEEVARTRPFNLAIAMGLLHVAGICDLITKSRVKFREKYDGATGFV